MENWNPKFMINDPSELETGVSFGAGGVEICGKFL